MSIFDELLKMRAVNSKPTEEQVEIVEVLDAAGRPLALLSRAEVLKQELPRKVALVLYRNDSGKIYIQKRSKHKKLYPGLWSCSASGFVQAGESIEEAALRELYEELGISGVPLKLIASRPASEETNQSAIFLYLSKQSAIVPSINIKEVADGMFICYDELYSLINTFPGMVTPALVWGHSCLNDPSGFEEGEFEEGVIHLMEIA